MAGLRWVALPLLLAAAACSGQQQAAAPATVPAALPQPAPEAPQGRRLSGAEYRRLVYGNTLQRQMVNGGTMTILVGAEGQQVLRLVAPDGQRGSDRGRSTISEDRICWRWTRINPSQETCFGYYLQPDGALLAIDLANGLTPTRFELRPGNPEGL